MEESTNPVAMLGFSGEVDTGTGSGIRAKACGLGSEFFECSAREPSEASEVEMRNGFRRGLRCSIDSFRSKLVVLLVGDCGGDGKLIILDS